MESQVGWVANRQQILAIAVREEVAVKATLKDSEVITSISQEWTEGYKPELN